MGGIIMLYSLLADEDIYFINLHAECALHTYSSEFYQYDIMLDARRTKGIYCKKVNANIFENIYEYDYEEKDICIDFSGIEEISKNNLVGFVSKIKKKICSKNQMVYFLNLRKEIYEETGMENFLQINNDNNGNIFAKMGNAKGTYTYSQLIMRKEKVFKERLEKMILESTDECTETQHQHTSVPVYLSHYINLKKMVEAKSRLLRLAIYYLALSMIDAGIMSNNPLDNSNISFFFHTINGGYIATQLAELFHIDLVYLAEILKSNTKLEACSKIYVLALFTNFNLLKQEQENKTNKIIRRYSLAKLNVPICEKDEENCLICKQNLGKIYSL